METMAERPAYGRTAQYVESLRDLDNEIQALPIAERIERNRGLVADHREEQNFQALMTPPALRAALDILRGADQSDPCVREAVEALNQALDAVARQRQSDQRERIEMRKKRDALLAQADRHPYYVDFGGLYVGQLAAAGIDASGIAPRGDGSQAAYTYATAYAEFLAGNRKSKPSPGSADFGRYFTDVRAMATRIREAIDAEHEHLRTNIRPPVSVAESVIHDTRKYTNGEVGYQTLTVDEIIERDDRLMGWMRDEIIAYLDAQAEAGQGDKWGGYVVKVGDETYTMRDPVRD